MTRAVVIRDYDQGPQLEDIEVADPGPGEILVRVHASGVCGSDLHVVHGRSVAVTLPQVMGHEGAGVVESVGAGVESFSPGDHVVIALYGPCHGCPSCDVGRFNQCSGEARMAAIMGKMADGSTRLRGADGESLHPMVGVGSLSERTVVRATQAVKIPEDVPFDLACLTGCGVTTGMGAVFNTAGVEPGQSVAVVGCGGVGLNVVRGAKLAGARAVVAVDANPAKLELATRLGATATVHADGGSITDLLADVVPGGIDVGFEVVGNPDLVVQLFSAVRPGGTCVMVGSPPAGTQLPIDARDLFNDRTLKGCLGGSNIPARDIPRLIDWYRNGGLDLETLVSVRRPLDEFQQAIDETDAGEVARSVILLA